MADYDNNNTGVLFKNDRKESEKQPDYKGEAELDGTAYWMSAWIKKSTKTGKPFMSFAFTPKQPQAKPDIPPLGDFNESADIPF